MPCDHRSPELRPGLHRADGTLRKRPAQVRELPVRGLVEVG
jgi:hypothetical protein